MATRRSRTLKESNAVRRGPDKMMKRRGRRAASSAGFAVGSFNPHSRGRDSVNPTVLGESDGPLTIASFREYGHRAALP
jgi:hypothetical protein